MMGRILGQGPQQPFSRPKQQALCFVLTCTWLFAAATRSSAQAISTEIPIQTLAHARNRSVDSTTGVARLRGTVTGFSGWKNSFFLQDGDTAISVDRAENTPVAIGDRVEVTGHPQPGLFANIFFSATTRVLGHGSLPTARVSTGRELQSGDYDSRLVEVRGTVRAARLGEIWGRKMLFLDLEDGGSTITAYLPGQASDEFQYLVDSEVRVRGVCGTIFNDHRQLIGLRLFLGEIQQVEVLTKGENPDSIPISSLDSLLTFHGPTLNHRVRVRGTLTYQAPGGDMILQQGRSSLRMQSPSKRLWTIGARVEAWGFVSSQGYLPYLDNASFQEVGTAKQPTPIQIEPARVFKFENGFLQAPYDGLVVQMGAKIVDRVPNTGSTIWVMEAEDVRFEAEMENAPSAWALNFESGTNVRITGICIADSDHNQNLKSFHILLRSPADLTVIARPHWNQSLFLLFVTYLTILIAGLANYTFLQKKFPGVAVNDQDGDSNVAATFSRISAIFAVFALLVALSIFFTTPPESLVLVAASVAILLGRRAEGRPLELVRLLCIGLITLKGMAGIAEGSTGWEWLRIAQMPLSTAASLFLVGCSSFMIRHKRFAGVGQMLAGAVGCTALLKLVGALYGASAGTGLAVHLLMSVPSAITLFLLSIALLLSTPESGFMAIVSSRRLGGLMLRHLIPAVVLVPIFIGWIRLQMQVFGLFDTRFGLTFFALSNVVCFCFLLWSSAAILNRLDRMKSKAEETLREREQKLELVFASGSMGDWVWNIEPDSLAAHPSVWKLYGEPEKWGSEPAAWFRSRQHPQDQGWLEEELKKAQLLRQPLDCEFRVIWPDSSIHWVYCRAVPVFAANGKLVQMSGINLDITNRKRAEAKLKENQELFQKLQDAMPQIVWTANAHGEITYYNQRWYDYTGLTSGESWSSIVHEGELRSILEKWGSSISSGVSYENKMQMRRASDGSYRWHLVRAVPVYDAHQTLQQWFGTCTDIDDFKRTSEELYSLNESLERRVEMRSRELAKAERKFRLLVESVKDYAIYMLDADGRVASWNEGAERLNGYSAAQIIGQHFSIFFPAHDTAEGEPERLLVRAAVEGNVSEEAQRVRRDGSQFWASVVINAVYDDYGRVTGFSKVVRDVTDRRRAEQLLIAARKQAEEANRAKSRFLAAMSHEIRTPMNAILGMADLLWDTVLDRTQREYVGRFRRAGANLLSLINDILDLSKIESGRFELEAVDFDLLELADRAMEIASPGAILKGIRLETQIVSETPTLLVGDPVRLQQILNNLISNAIKFTSTGRVLLQIQSHSDGRTGHLQFAVSDTGIGIQPDKLGAIFEDFIQAENSTTRRFGGTGLGLGICRRLAEKMDGALTVESVPEQGSTFRFDAAFSVSSLATAAAPKELSDLTGRYVLVIDDNATNRMIICEMCAAWGMKTRSAASAVEALQLMTEAREASEDFALVLLDRVLPDARGFETLREIKCLDPTIPVIISSSDQQFGDLAAAKALGAAAYLMKPIRRTELRSCIFEALSTAATRMGKDLVGNQTEELKRALKILLVEDSEDNRFLVQAYLTGRPYELSYAEDGQQAVDAFANGEFDLILMDVQMPIMDGHTATKRIRSLEKERLQSPIAIVALTANALLEDSKRSLEAGCNGHLPKPVSKDKLIAAIEHYGNHRSAGEGDGFRIPPGFETISRKYIRKQLDRINQMRSSLARGGMDELRHVGHELKGSGTSYGFADLTALGAALEEAAKASDLGQLEAQISRIEHYVRLAVESLG